MRNHPSGTGNQTQNQNQHQNTNPFLQRKADEIEALLSQPEIDLWQLRELALSPGGLVNDTIRKRAWPKLAWVVVDSEQVPPSSTLLVESMDASQIDRDVARCTWHLLTGSQRSRHSQHRTIISVLLKKKQNRLANLINLTLPSPHRLRYYQGYHDVASNASVSSEPQHYPSGDLELPSKVLCQVSFSHFRDALQSDFLRLQTGLKLMLFPLMWKIDPEVHRHLLDADMEPFFCLSWILTWFAHDVRDTGLVKRLFDAFLVAHPALPVYTSLAMIAHPYNRRIILETDCDFAALHQCLASLP
eukprot:jgi/Psemu1/204327/e_gw1.347.28.1